MTMTRSKNHSGDYVGRGNKKIKKKKIRHRKGYNLGTTPLPPLIRGICTMPSTFIVETKA